MIIVNLTGGIGNQMFQYAAARRVSYVNNTQLYLDLSWFNESGLGTNRKYELEVFNIVSKVATPSDIAPFKTGKQNPLTRRLPNFLKKIVFHTNQTHISEKDFSFDSDMLNVKDNVYLDGYWQSEKYFIDIEQIVRREFAFKTDPTEKNRQASNIIISSESVSVHIRRGDYVTLPQANAFHGLCPAEYYRSASDKIAKQVSKPVFFIFSDDITWVKDNLKLGHETIFIDHNDPDHGYEDLRLMSLCKHHIIANSSFSWWGAWLNPSPHKIVIAPQIWFQKASHDTRDLIPPAWIRL
jgi:hypothetical protein